MTLHERDLLQSIRAEIATIPFFPWKPFQEIAARALPVVERHFPATVELYQALLRPPVPPGQEAAGSHIAIAEQRTRDDCRLRQEYLAFALDFFIASYPETIEFA